MYQATNHGQTEGEHPGDGVDWYVRKFRLEAAEGQVRVPAAQPEVPEVRSRKWLLAVVAVVFGLSALLALASFLVTP